MLRFLALRSPLLLGGAVWAAGAALLLINLLLPALHHGTMRLSPPLAGVTLPEKPRGSWESLMHGSYQAIYGRLIGTRMPLYADAVRLRNQLEFSLFGVTPIPGLAVGTGPALFELAYSEEYCSRDIAAWRPGAERWAARIRDMQDMEEHRGKTFLYVLTPSKVAQYPGILPAGYACPSPQSDRIGLVPAWLGILAAAGVHVADTTATMLAAHGAYPFAMFPRGGTHWNGVGAALSEQTAMAALDRLKPDGGFAPFRFTWHLQAQPEGIDVDLARLMNLFRPFPSDPVPAVDVQPAAPPVPCPATRVVIVGGSFSHAMLEELGRATCNPPAVEYEYWRVNAIGWNGKALELQALDPGRRAADIMAADVLVYEENEEILRHPQHGEALWQFLHDEAGHDQAG